MQVTGYFKRIYVGNQIGNFSMYMTGSIIIIQTCELFLDLVT